MLNRKKTKYTYAFKEEAIRLAGLPSRSAASVARELGIPAWKLRSWIKESKEKLEISWEMGEVHRLEMRVMVLEEENEILKKSYGENTVVRNQLFSIILV